MENKSTVITGRSPIRQAGLAALFLSVALPFMGSAAPALAAEAAPSVLTAEAGAITQTARNVCHATLGLNAGNSDFRACVDSLSQSRRQQLADSAQSKVIQIATAACDRAGLAANSPAYATCVLNHSDSRSQVAQASVQQGE